MTPEEKKKMMLEIAKEANAEQKAMFEKEQYRKKSTISDAPLDI